MWEVMHRLVAEEGLRLTPSRPADTGRANPPAPPPEESPAVQSESDPRLRGEPLPDDDAPGPSCRPPWSAPAPPVAPASPSGPSTTPAPAPAPSAPDPPAVPAADEPASVPRRMPAQLLRLPPSAYTSSHDHPLFPRSKRAAEHLVRSYAGCSEVWWGTFIEVWDSFMVEVQRLSANPAA